MFNRFVKFGHTFYFFFKFIFNDYEYVKNGESGDISCFSKRIFLNFLKKIRREFIWQYNVKITEKIFSTMIPLKVWDQSYTVHCTEIGDHGFSFFMIITVSIISHLIKVILARTV